MKDVEPEFDQFSDSYEQLLNDPFRDRFAPGGSEFFHLRKRDIIRDHFCRDRTDTRKLAYLDLGCGKGELAHLLRNDFGRVAGCDPSAGMLKAGEFVSQGVEARVQHDPGRIPFEGGEFDFVTAVCIFHHVPLSARAALLQEARRVLKPGGTLAVIEHNPYNPVTRLIVSRTPVDADAILLRPAETRRLFHKAGFTVDDQRYFLYFSESVYRRLTWLESALGKVPFGGQYAVFGVSA
jgi:ubiquinone/menaquinone biosynthesis C-methylase UbiE